MKKIIAFILVLPLALSLCACSRASQIPSLAEIAENGAEWGGEQIQQVQGCTLADLEKAWGKADGELLGEYAYFWKVDDTTSVNVYYHKNAEIERISVTGLEEWLDGIAFVELAPGEEIKSPAEIIVDADNSTIQFVITYARSGLTLEYGVQAEDGTEYSREIVGGNDAYAMKDIPAGTYFLFVRNGGDYSDLPAYKDKSISFNATGAINYYLADEQQTPNHGPANIPQFSYEGVLQTWGKDDPGVKTNGFQNTSETVISTSLQAIELAKNECTIEYDTTDVSYDSAASIWQAVFYKANTAGGGQTIYMDSDGVTCLIVYGE